MALDSRSDRSTLPLIAFAFATAMSTAARAQDENPTTPGAIPNPGSYQGSQVLQQQSDQQDQQFRQQQQGQQQQNAPGYGGQYSGGNYGSRSYGQAPSLSVYAQCLRRETRSLTALRGLVVLSSGDSLDDPRYFAISKRPAATEKTALMQWRAGRRRCNTFYTWSPNPVVQQAQMSGVRDMENMIAALAQGRMSYGEFNYQRAQKARQFKASP